jgi:hypothetical protein
MAAVWLPTRPAQQSSVTSRHHGLTSAIYCCQLPHAAPSQPLQPSQQTHSTSTGARLPGHSKSTNSLTSLLSTAQHMHVLCHMQSAAPTTEYAPAPLTAYAFVVQHAAASPHPMGLSAHRRRNSGGCARTHRALHATHACAAADDARLRDASRPPPWQKRQHMMRSRSWGGLALRAHA